MAVEQQPPGALPRVPSPSYMLELGATHLVGDRLLTGSRLVIADAMSAVSLPDNLRRPFDNWHTGGHLGAVGAAAQAMSAERPRRAPLADRVEAVQRSALLLSAVSIANTVVTNQGQERNAQNVGSFFDNTSNALLVGAYPRMIPDGPEQQVEAYAYAREVGSQLGFVDEERGFMGDLFAEFKQTWLEHLAEGTKNNLDPTAILENFGRRGLLITKMAAVAATGGLGHRVLENMGRIGGMEEGKSVKPVGGLHTHTSAMIAEFGEENGRAFAGLERRRRQTKLYRQAMNSGLTPRQRRVFRTVTFFATTPASHP